MYPGLSTFTPECFRGANGPNIVHVANPFGCYKATSKIFGGQPPRVWDSEKLWTFGTCAAGQMPTTMKISSVVFTRTKPAYVVILTKNSVNKENHYFGGTMSISELAIFKFIVCVLGND